MSRRAKRSTVLVPTIDKRLATVCERFRGLATAIEQHWHHGLVHHFVEEHVIQAYRGWKVEVLVRELEDYLNGPEEDEQVPLPIASQEAIDLLQQILKDCEGARGITSPCAPKPDLLQQIQELLKRAPDNT
jgi:hypothetical protein